VPHHISPDSGTSYAIDVAAELPLHDENMTVGSGSRRRCVLVIFNPIAGRNARGKLARALGALEALGVAAVVRETAAPGDAESFARAARASDFDALAIAGGDGTINEVVNGLEDERLPIAIFPFGTENVLAREIGVPRNPASAAGIAVEGSARAIAVGEAAFEAPASVRRFLLMVGVGFDADVVHGLDLGLKRRVGKLAFAWSILVRLWRYRPVEYEVTTEDAGVRTTHRAASAVASRARYYAGPFILAPAARLADRSFQLVLFKRGSRRAALRYMVALAGGFLHRLSDVEIATATSTRIAQPAGAPVQMDGDPVGRLPVSVRIAERSVLLIYPGS